jgi:hypothetical protein
MPRPRLVAPLPTLLGGVSGLGGSASPAPPGTAPNAALLSIELSDREIDRLRDSEVQPRQQFEGSQQLHHRCHLDRLTVLSSLHSSLANPGLGSHLSLGPVALEAVALKPTTKLSENSRVGGGFVEMHQF